MTSARQDQELSIGELARRTGLEPQTLRAWETRYGFPTARRTDTGHRRFTPDDVTAVTRVLALRQTGLRMEQAVDRVRRDASVATNPSIFGELRRNHPELPVQRLRRPTLVELSRAIEDEAWARAGRAVVFGAFQRGAFYRAVRRRWEELARTAATCVVFAGFDDVAGSLDEPGPVRVDLPDDSPMLREWAVVVWSPHLAAVLTAWEVPGSGPAARDRTFESLFSVDPAAVRTAARTCLATAAQAGLDLPVDLDDHAPLRPTPAAVDALCLRAFGYLDR